MARASGLELLGGVEENDPIAAATHGTGELIARAVKKRRLADHRRNGGSATTDGGLGTLHVYLPLQRLRGVEIIVACDVTTRFVDAAEVFSLRRRAQRPLRSSSCGGDSSAWCRSTGRPTGPM